MERQLRQKVCSEQETELATAGWRGQPGPGTGNMNVNLRPQGPVKIGCQRQEFESINSYPFLSIYIMEDTVLSAFSMLYYIFL